MEITGKINVLYVDDELNNINSFRATFRKEYNVFTALSGPIGLEILREHVIHIIITDQRMPDMTGVEFLVEFFQCLLGLAAHHGKIGNPAQQRTQKNTQHTNAVRLAVINSGFKCRRRAGAQTPYLAIDIQRMRHTVNR